MADWKPGDVVQLKSGGPNMTVDHLAGDGTWWCVWFVNDEERRGGYSAETLREAPSGHIDQDETE